MREWKTLLRDIWIYLLSFLDTEVTSPSYGRFVLIVTVGGAELESVSACPSFAHYSRPFDLA
jgi:hypothetical protein